MSGVVGSPATGFSIIANLGDNRQITAQFYVERDDDVAAINAQLDKAQQVIDRQRAKYSLDDLRKDRETAAQTLARAEDDLARVETDFTASQEANKLRLGTLAEQIKGIDDAAHERGRSQPVGGDASRRRALQQEQKDIAELMAKNQAERDQHRQNVVISIGRFREAVEALDRDIAKAEALVGEGG